jgi:hypothetical protein
MDQLQGVATSVRRTATVASPGIEQPTSTVHIALLRIGGQQVEMQTSRALGISEGDQLLVVGKRHNDVFKALAHKNYTTGASHAENWLVSAAMALFVCGASGKIMLSAAGEHALVPLLVAGALGIAGGIYFLRRSLRLRTAARIVNAAV